MHKNSRILRFYIPSKIKYSTLVEGGMIITCTGKNMPKNEDKKHFELDFKSTVRFDVCKEDSFSGHTSILLDHNDFNFTDTGVTLKTPFFNKCKCEARSSCNNLSQWGVPDYPI